MSIEPTDGQPGAAGEPRADGPAEQCAPTEEAGWSRPPVATVLRRPGVLLSVIGALVAGLLIEGALRRSGSRPAEPLPSRPVFVGLARPVLEKTPLVYESDYWA